jgi:steroid delta-isomerase-like uncharacterized protein
VSTEENKSLIHRWVDVWNTQRLDDIDRFVTPGYVRHDPTVPEVHGPEGEKQLAGMYLAAFPDLRFTVEDLVAEGDKVVARYTVRGTHRGELMGIPPTGNQIAVEAMEIYRLEDGRIAEQWVVMDGLGMMQQLGVIPAS